MRGKSLKVYSLNDELLFGKYKGQKVSEIIAKDLSYILWLLKNVEDIDFWGDVVKLLDDKYYRLSAPIHEIQHYDSSKSHRSGFTHSPRNPDWIDRLSEYQKEYEESQSEESWYDEPKYDLIDDALEGDASYYWNIDN